MAKWKQQLLAARERQEKSKISSSMSGENLLSNRGKMYDSHNRNTYGYTTLSKRFDNLYKKALDYYNNDAYKGFYDTYSGGVKTEGYDANAGSLYRDLEKQSKEANEGIDELLAELDQYSRYYNEDAVKYVRDLITKRQGSYNDILKSAGEYRDQFAQWKDEDDYNADVWQGKFAEAYNAGNYDEAEALLMERGKTLQEKYGAQLINNEEYKELLKYEEAIKGIRANEAYKAEEAKKKAEYEAYDADAGTAEIEALKQRAQELDAPLLIEWAQDLGILGKQGKDRAAEFDRVQQEIADKQAYHDKALKAKSTYKLTDAAHSDPEFEKYAAEGVAIKNPEMPFIAFGWNDDDLENIVTYSRENADTIRANQAEHADVAGDSKYAQMTEDEVKIYSYYLAKYGKEKAQEYLDAIDEELTKKETDYINGVYYDMAQKFPVLSSLGSVATSLGSGAEYLVDLAKYAYDSSSDPYGAQMGKNSLAEITNATRGAVSDEVNWMIGEWDAHDFLYNTAMSGVDSLAASTIPGGGVVLGLSAAAQGTNDALERGLSSEQAFWNGAVQGVFEGLFESVSLGKFKSLQEAVVKGGKDIALNIAKSMLVNASEEAATEVANILYDTIANGDLANYTWEELQNGAWKDALAQVGESAASGALMGLGFGGAGSLISDYNSRKEGKQYKSDPATLIDEALRIDPKNELALSLQKKLADGKKISSVELGRLSRIDSENVAEALKKGDEGIKARETSAREDVKKSIDNLLASKIARPGNEKTISSLAETITKAALGEEVSNAEIRRLSKNAAGIAALNNELGLQKKDEKLKVGDSVSAIREAISSKQSSKTKLSTNNILATVAALADMDEAAERGLYTSYAADVRNGREVTPEAYAAAYANAMSDGKKGVDLADVKARYADVLSESSVTMAYRSGENATKILSEDLQNGTDSDTINTNAQEVQNEQGIHLRDGGERYDGQNTQGQIPGMEGNARPNQSRREGRTGPRDAEAVNLTYDREVSAKDFGISGGLESGKVKIVAEGSETTSMKEAKKYAAERGLNVVFFGGGNMKIQSGKKSINARAFIQDKNVYVRVDHSEFTADQLMRHETGHDMIDKGEIDIKDVRKRLKEKFTPEELNAVARAYLEAYKDTGLNADEVWTEIICDSLGDMNIFEGTDKKEAAEMAADFLPDLKETALEGRKEARAPPKEAQVSGEISDANFSIEFAEDIAENQRAYVDRGNAAISAEELEKAIADTAKMVEAMKPYANILPQDKVGKTLVKNGSYDMSVENTTICIRTLAYNSFVDMVSEKVGRPLTQMESFLVSQKLYEIAKEPQCLYCYVSLDRKAFNEMVIRYVEQRDAAIDAYKKAGEPKIPSSFDAEWSLFKSFLEGRKPTTNMWDRYVGWIKAYKNGDRLVTLSDISTEAKRAKLVEDGGKRSAQVVDILKYAQSASWAKKQTQYVAYYDEILKLKPGVIKNLNSHYGMRWYSFSDYSGAFIVENMQQVTDAAIRGLKGLSYTKDTDYAEIFAPTGMNINISVYAMKGKDGYVIDPKQSADIDKAIKLRKQYPNVGIVVVATDKAGVDWALAQEWSDVVIPFHTVRTGADVADFYKWEIFNSEQSDVISDQNLWDAYVKNVGKKKVSKNVYPSEHQNNRETYLQICAERGLTPRFNSFIDNPNYMKLVNETRQSEAQTQPLKPNFDLGAAERSFDKFVDKGGYYEGWYNDGIDVDGEADIVAEDVRAGKKANEVEYGRQDISYEDIQKKRKQNREHGHASFDLEMLEDTTTEEQDLSDRERLAAMLESDDMSPSQKGLLTKYKNKLSEIEANEAEITRLTEELDALKNQGKGNTSRAVVLESKISKLEKQNAVSEGIILNLEATKPIKRLLERERKAAYQEGLLAGQMAQGRRDAQIIRHANERIEANARAYLESRAKSAERREKTALKKDIRKLAKDINTLLKKSDKKKNVKQEQQTAVATTLALAEILFNDDIRNEDIVRLGVDSITNEESKLLNKYRDLLDKRDATIAKIDSIYGNGIVKEDLVEQVEAIEKELAKINNSISYLNEKLSKVFEREKARLNKSTVDAVFDALITEYSKLANSDKEYVKNAYSEVVKTRLEALKQDLSGTIAKDMSTSQLTEVRDIFKAIKHMISKSNNIFREGREEDLGKYVSNTQKEIFESTTEPKDRGVVINALLSTFNEFSWNNLRPVDAFERLGSKTFEKLFWDYIDGMGVAARDVAEARNVIANAREKYGYSKWNMKLADTTYTTRDGLTFKPTLGDKLSIYAYSKREKADGTKQAMGHMVEGGFTYDTGETYKDVEKGKTYARKKLSSPYRLSERNIKGIIASLTQEQRDYVDAILPYLTDMGKKGNEVSMTLYGIELFGDKIYFPLQSSADYLSSTTQELGATQTMSSLANSGFTKQTNPNADNPIVLRAFDDVVLEHIEKMSNYHGLVVPIENLRRVFDNVDRDAERNSLSTKALIGSRFGDEAQKYFSQMLTDFNGGISPSGAKNMFAKLFSKGKAMAVSANLSVVAQQYFSIIRAMEVVNPKYFVPFLNSEAKKTDIKQYEELMKYAPIAIIKEMNGFDVGSSGRVKDYIGYDNARKDAKYVRKKVDDVSMWGASAMDKLGWITIWKAIKAEVASEQKLNPGTKTFYAACEKRFTEVVTKTQVYDSVASRSGYMRSKSDAVKYATSFMGEPTVIMGRYFINGVNLIRAIKSKNRAKITKSFAHLARAAAIMSVSQALANLAKSLVYAGRDDEEDEAFLEKWAKNFAMATASDLNPLNSLPFTRDIMSIIEGWDVERPDLTLIADAVTSVKKFHDGITFDEALGFIGAAGNLFGIPFKNIVREIKSAVNAFEDIAIDDVVPTDMGGAFVEGFTGEERTKKKTLYNAIVSGDKGRVQAIRDTYKSDEAYKAAVKSALRENDLRIKKAARAHSNGNIRGFNDYINTIVAEGFFDRNMVASAIRAEQSAFNTKISEAADAKNKGNDKEYKKIVKDLLDSYDGIYSKEEIVDLITKAQKKLLETQDDSDTEDTTSIWKSSDITYAFDGGDTDMALDIIAELIEIKLKKKLDEARETAKEKGKDFDEDDAREDIEYEIMSSLRSSLTKHYKPLYYAAYLSGDNKEMNRIRDILITSELYEYKSDKDVDDVLEEWIESYEEE